MSTGGAALVMMMGLLLLLLLLLGRQRCHRIWHAISFKVLRRITRSVDLSAMVPSLCALLRSG